MILFEKEEMFISSLSTSAAAKKLETDF